MATKSPTVANCDVSILARVVERAGEMPAEAARFVLKMDFPKKDIDRMNKLAAKAREGALSDAEGAELDAYLRVGYQLGILQSKARVALRRSEAEAV